MEVKGHYCNLLFMLPGQNTCLWWRQVLSIWEMGPLHFSLSCPSPFLIFYTKRARTCASGISLTEPKEFALHCILPVVFPNKTVSTRCCKPPPTVIYSTSESSLEPFNKGKYCVMFSNARAEEWVLNVDAIPDAFLKDACCLELTVLEDKK